MELNVDPARLGQAAGALGGQGSALTSARDELGGAVSTAAASLGTVNDDGLHSALARLGDAWGYETSAIASDIAATAGAMSGLAQAYAQGDSSSASQLDSWG